ncbi:MAG: hypothetical protein QOK37_1656 [Thermoanaerobaculia bacterium]|jgi:hypothetical protein|nr:hypothetical protein [Thermoanaerobaculia bacterium]
MKRTLIIAAWITGSIVPLLASVVFVFGCCVLPFHRYVHRVMPLCRLAVDFIAPHGHDDARKSLPAREKQEPVRRIATSLPRVFQLAAITNVQRATAIDATIYRSFISLGAVRCDQDVGLYLLDGTLLI